MFKFNAREFIGAYTIICDLAKQLETVPNLDQFLQETEKEKVSLLLDQTKDHCEILGLDLSIILIDEIKSQMSGDYKATLLKRSLDCLDSRIIHEISAPLLLSIRREKGKFFECDFPFDQDVFDKFPSANFDIEEASKCFALSRFTGCVMHLQRVMEIGLQGYGEYLNIGAEIKLAQPRWGRVLDITGRRISDITNHKIEGRKWESSYERMFCEGIQAFLVAVKTAWRNPSMHADQIYTEEQTEDIYVAVKGFMRHTAKHLTDRGESDFKSQALQNA